MCRQRLSKSREEESVCIYGMALSHSLAMEIFSRTPYKSVSVSQSGLIYLAFFFSLCRKLEKTADVNWHEWWLSTLSCCQESKLNLPYYLFIFYTVKYYVLLRVHLIEKLINKTTFWSYYGVSLWSRRDVLPCFVDSKMSIWEEHYVCFADWEGFYLSCCFQLILQKWRRKCFTQPLHLNWHLNFIHRFHFYLSFF